MLAFITQVKEGKRKSLQVDAKPLEGVGSMDISKEFFEVVQLSFKAKDSNEDSENSKETNKMINTLEVKMETLFDSICTRMDAKFDDIVVLAVTYYNLGIIYNNCKEEYKLRIALTYFKTCLKLLRDKELDPKAILISISAFNGINSVLVKLNLIEKNDYYDYTYLQLALNLYLNYTKEDNYPDPVHIPTIIGVKEEESNPKIILEDLHFLTLRNIIGQYMVQPEDKDEFVAYMHNLLEKQFSQMVSEGKQFQEDCVDWVLTLFDVLKYFLINNRFIEAKNYLATADYVTYKFSEETLKTINQQNEVSRMRFIYLSDSYDYLRAVIAKSWGTYGNLLLRFWLKRFLQNKDKICDVNNSKLEIESCEKSTNLLIFTDMKKEAECMTNQITHTCILNLDDAKSVFVNILKQFDIAKTYFTADADIETYAKIVLEVSAAYKYLAGFEQSRDVQLKLHKQRVEYLENVCKKFHTIIDINTEFETYKRVWCEVVTSCSAVMDLMLEETYHNKSRKISSEMDRFAKLILGKIDLYLHVGL